MQVMYDLLDKKQKYVVGVSGGPDSMALLDILYKKGYALIVCLVNYHVRSDSHLDATLVRNYCQERNIIYHEHNQYAYNKGNFEAQARIIRYDFYLATCKQYQCDSVVLAHHKDDFLETALMQKNRGMIDVPLGMKTVSNYQNMRVLRPLMACFKEELVAYCDTYHVPYRIDYTNLENIYTRNYYRNEVLSKYTKEEKEALYVKIIKENEILENKEAHANAWLEEHLVNHHLSLEALLKEKDALYLLRRFLLMEKGLPNNKISHGLVEECLKNLKKAGPNVKISLPVNFVLIKEYDNIYVTKIKKAIDYEYMIEDGTPCDYGFFKIADAGEDREGIALSQEDFPLTIRNRRSGDVIELSYGKKKLNRLFIDAKVPSSARDMWPVVLNSRQEIILVPKIAKNKCYLLAKPTLFVIQ